jgi:N-methylhydantoinase A
MLKVPAVDVAEVGAGAGSIAWIDAGGLLRVGPESAGAVPGPACYALGGTRPTVTDANVVLGFLNPAYLAGGELRLDARRAHDAIARDVAAPLGLSVADAAHGIREVANASMARATRAVTIERGRDPRDYTLIAFGGSGPVHAVDVARALEIRRVLVPISPGVFTAVGMLASDLEHHFVRAHGGALASVDLAAATSALTEMARQARAMLASEGYAAEATRLAFAADLRYEGQGSELTVPLPGETLDDAAMAALTDGFRAEYAKSYGYATEEPLELVNFRLVATGVRGNRLDFRSLTVAARPAAAGRRLVVFARGAAPIETPVHPRESVVKLDGPAIIEAYDSTIVLPPGCAAATDGGGNLLITLRD